MEKNIHLVLEFSKEMNLQKKRTMTRDRIERKERIENVGNICNQ